MINHAPQETSAFERPEGDIKRKFWGGLENVLKGTRKHWKEIITAIALPFIFSNSVNAGYLSTRCASSFTKPPMGISHESGAREPEEGYDNGKDVLFNDMAFPPTIDIYSNINFDPYRLKVDARDPNSTTTITAEISGRLGGILPEPQDAELQFKWGISSGIGNFSKKNIIGELSQRVDDGEGGYKYALIGDYDIKNLVNSTKTIPISTTVRLR